MIGETLRGNLRCREGRLCRVPLFGDEACSIQPFSQDALLAGSLDDTQKPVAWFEQTWPHMILLLRIDFDATLGFPGEGPADGYRIEDFVQVPSVIDAADARSGIAKGDRDTFFVMGTESEATRLLFEERRPFRVLELVPSDRGIWTNAANTASISIGCLSWVGWIRRMQLLTIIPPVEVGRPWSWKGRSLPGHILVCMEMTSEDGDMKFQICLKDAIEARNRISAQGPDAVSEMEDLGELPTVNGASGREELVIETTSEDARRIRQTDGVKHIAQRRACPGRVRATVDVDAERIGEVTKASSLWARSSISAPRGVVLYQTEEQWDALGGALTAETWVAGRLICESPRWVSIGTGSSDLSGCHRWEVDSDEGGWQHISQHIISCVGCRRGWHRHNADRDNQWRK